MIIVYSMTSFRETFSNASAIIIYQMRDTDPLLKMLEEVLPFKNASTLFVFGGREAPGNPLGFHSNHVAFKDLFNITLGYRRDSDVYFPYNHIIKLEKGQFKSIEPTLPLRT